MTAQAYRAWTIGGAVVAISALLLAGWAYHWLGDTRYGGVATISETISRRTNEPAPQITNSVTISQTFIASDNDLTEVQVFLGTYMRRNTAALELTLRDDGGNTIATKQIDPASVFDNAYYPFIFDRIERSRGESYEVTISSPDGRDGNAFTAWISDCDCYPAGELSINGTPQPNKELVLRADYHHDGVVTWRELLDRMSQYKPLIFKGVGLALLVMIAASLAMAALGAFVTTVVPEPESRAEHARPLWIAAAAAVSLVVILVTTAYKGI